MTDPERLQTRIATIWRPGYASNPVAVYSNRLSDATDSPLLQPGDTILVSCGYGFDQNNDPVLLTFGDQEAWPIRIKPGITIKEYINGTYNAPAVIAAPLSNLPASGVPLILFTDNGGVGWNAADPTSQLIGVDLIGGDIGALVKSENGSAVVAVVEDVSFIRNRVGLQVEATGLLTLPVTIRDCTIASSVPATYHLLRLNPYEVGMRFWSLDSSSTDHPRIEAEIINLQTAGGYSSANMNPIGKLSGSTEACDLAGYTPASGSQGSFTRIVEVGVRGNVYRPEYLEPPSASKQAVSAVKLSVNGGILDGRASADSNDSGNGWDVGIYAVADTPVGAVDDVLNYTSWFDISTSGTLIQNCRASGIYVQTNTGTRGHLTMNNQSVVQKTGVQLASTAQDILYSGVHAVAKRSYLTVKGDTMMIRDNVGNGLLCYSPGNTFAPVPKGLFLGFKRVGIHDNGRCGVRMEAGITHGGGGTFPRVSGAVVGGTQVSVASNVSLVSASATPLIGDFPLQGQGYLNRCVISGGGDGTYGLYFKLRGNSLLTAGDDPLDFSAIALRAVNTYVWGFAQGGVYAELERHDALESGPTLLTPLVHCTIADNPAFSVDIKEVPNANCRYYRDDPTGEYLNTMFVHSIFDTRGANPDFGPNLDPATGGANWRYDDGTGSHLLDLDFPHLASIRAFLTNSILFGSGTTSVSVAYEGTPAGLNPDQWFLDSFSASAPLTVVEAYLNAGGDLAEDVVDIEAFPRNPMPTTQRNKGGEEDH